MPQPGALVDGDGRAAARQLPGSAAGGGGVALPLTEHEVHANPAGASRSPIASA